MRYVPHGSESALAAPSHASPALPLSVADAETLAAAIARAVTRETAGRIRHLQVAVQRQEVVLSGQCDSYYAKQMAQHAAMTLQKTGQLLNQIEVLEAPATNDHPPLS